MVSISKHARLQSILHVDSLSRMFPTSSFYPSFFTATNRRWPQGINEIRVTPTIVHVVRHPVNVLESTIACFLRSEHLAPRPAGHPLDPLTRRLSGFGSYPPTSPETASVLLLRLQVLFLVGFWGFASYWFLLPRLHLQPTGLNLLREDHFCLHWRGHI